MQLKGQVLGYDDIATFELSDVIGSYKEDDVLYIQTDFGETPIRYSTIEPVLPIIGLVPATGEGEGRMISSDQEAVNLLEIHRFAFKDEADNMGCAAGNPDGGSALSCKHCQLIRDIEEIDQILNKASVVMQRYTCDACLDIIRKEIEDEAKL